MSTELFDAVAKTRILDAIANVDAVGNWGDVYQAVYDALTDLTIADDGRVVGADPKQGVDETAWVWIGGAKTQSNPEAAVSNPVICTPKIPP
jgi:hypothetical protein